MHTSQYKDNDSEILKIECEKYSVSMDKDGNIRKITFQNKVFEPPLVYTFFELDGELSETEYLPNTKDLSYQLFSKKSTAKMNISFDKELRFHLVPEKKDAVKKVGVVLTFPIDTVFHLAEYPNIGRMLDKDMPLGESYTARLVHNFFVAEYNGMWLRFRTDNKKRLDRAKFHIARDPEMFTVTFTWRSDADARLALFSSLDAVLDEHEKWLETECGVQKLKDNRDIPDWIHAIKLVITADMLRSNWEVTHDYLDLLNFAKEIKEIRDPKEILFYIPGWHGAYDSTHPTYRPHEDLGGVKKFRQMIDFLHRNGFRLMIHTTGWGIDPYHPNIDKLQELLVKDDKGEFLGWQINENSGPAQAPSKFKTGRIVLAGSARAKNFFFKTVAIPNHCEALFTIGGLKAKKGRIRLTVGRRTISTPRNWFESHNQYDFPFPLALEPGENEVQVTTTGTSEVDWRESWYKIRYTFMQKGPYGTWTFPILQADMKNAEYIQIFTNSVSSAVREFGIDAVHVDAAMFYGQLDGKELLLNLKKKLPDIAIGGEGFQTSFEAMNFWDLCQHARQSLTDYRETKRYPEEQTSLTPLMKLDELYAWLDKPSPVCRFVKKYLIIYPHLCAANAFVPVGKVCNTYPPRLMPLKKEEQWKVLRDAKRMDYMPGLRINYRKYGLDDETRKAIHEIGK